MTGTIHQHGHLDTTVIPGTVHLVDLEGIIRAKHASEAQLKDVVLIPAPSGDPDDPLNWSPQRKIISTVSLSMYTLMVGIASAAIYSVLEPISDDTGLTLADLNAGTGYMFLGKSSRLDANPGDYDMGSPRDYVTIGFVFCFFFMEETNYDRAPLEMVSTPEDTPGTTTPKEEILPTSTDPEKTAAISGSGSPHSVGVVEYSPKTYYQKLSLLDKKRDFHLFRMMIRPLIFLSFPSIAYAGFSYGSNLVWFNVLNGTASLILSAAPYNFSSSMVGLSYVSPLIGVACGSLYSGLVGDRIVLWLARRNQGVLEPEHRLWLFSVSLLLIPGSLILWGVGAAHHIHWFGLIFAMGVIAVSNSIGVQLSVSYCIDSYKDLSGEAMVTVIIIRNTMSFAIGYGGNEIARLDLVGAENRSRPFSWDATLYKTLRYTKRCAIKTPIVPAQPQRAYTIASTLLLPSRDIQNSTGERMMKDSVGRDTGPARLVNVALLRGKTSLILGKSMAKDDRWCGVGSDYCASPDCQFLYGPACDANTIPAGDSTASIPRPQWGDVPYGGAGIYDYVAFTFDDGPYNYTSDLLDKLAVYNASASFMITGNNLGKGPIDSTPEWTAIIQRMYASGHQIVSHTWTHQNLTSLDPTYFERQMVYNEMAFRNILGFFPTYMSECNDTCGEILATMGYHVTYFSLDTEGYLDDSPELIQNSKNIWDAAIASADNATDSILEIEHDIHYQTVYNLTDYILASMYEHGFRSVTVGECLGDPPEYWYRSGNASAVVPIVQSISSDGSCNINVTCQGSSFGNCCSANGWCAEMENRGLDLEKELTCSICTEVLYQPLTLLDCLHTFCGSCLKEWFSWQLASSRKSPSSIPAGSTPYTCPSCRASVRDTKHNATVTTLLEMFMVANPDKGKTEAEKEEMRGKYTVGENVLPKVDVRDMSLRERRAEDEDRRLVDEVREASLRELRGDTSEARRERRRREEGRLNGSRTHSSRDNSRDSRHTEDRERHRRREEERGSRDNSGALRPDASSSEGRRRRRSNEESRRRDEESNRTAARQIEHQSSLRSLISSSYIDSHDMEEEILRQIREEGLLEGIDLENIDVSQEDQISERIAEAFRRRQAEKLRQERARRSSTSERRRTTRSANLESTETSGDDASVGSRRRPHSRSTSAVGEGRSRPPPSMSATHAAHLDVQSSDEGRRRRRTTSSSRSATAPVPVAEPEARETTRSQTELSERPRSSIISTSRPLVTVTSRSSTDPNIPNTVDSHASDQASQEQPTLSARRRLSVRSEDSSLSNTSHTSQTNQKTRAAPPADISVPSSSPTSSSTMVDRSLVPAPLSPRQRSGTSLSDWASALSSGSRPSSSSSITSRVRPQLYPEPSLTCARCGKPHIEYELHYNCAICSGGHYNICRSCYLSGAGCLFWFGFGYTAWPKWEKYIISQAGEITPDAAQPHMLTANRYIAPKATAGGADGRRTLTTEDPQKRLQSGVFCVGCLAWANECYWRCDACNDGDWGFCNLCVNQGRSCTHPLLPLAYKPSDTYTPPLSPTHDQQAPPSATILTGPGVIDVGPFKPLTFSTKCDICHYPIQPSTTRYHCFSCISAVPNTQPGDYDICTTCYPKLVSSRRISIENGNNGWRRCLKGHRMVIVGFEDNRGGQRRVIVSDLVGGRGLHEELTSLKDHTGAEIQKWSWGDGARMKLVMTDVMKSAPITLQGMVIERSFPPDGGIGMSCRTLWSRYGDAGDELHFPRGAELRECKDVNVDWYHGSYMGKRGLFPSNHVKILDKGVGI
ncbi:hypothetical protein B7494_g3391 [Chlorociboria aeruginascens]|nr:hypothetical protein B7494_g3391 [Chlorociboria aeruginascens]